MLIQDHFEKVMSRPNQRSIDLDWDKLPLPQVELQGLGDPFTEEELKHAVFAHPADKAPGPDGFTWASSGIARK